MQLKILEEPLAVCRISADAAVPAGILDVSFCAVTRTVDELSIVLPESQVDASWRVEAGWRALQVLGPLAFDVVGVVASLSAPLADAGIPIFVISTFDTDYVLVKEERLGEACRVLEGRGHLVGRMTTG